MSARRRRSARTVPFAPLAQLFQASARGLKEALKLRDLDTVRVSKTRAGYTLTAKFTDGPVTLKAIVRVPATWGRP